MLVTGAVVSFVLVLAGALLSLVSPAFAAEGAGGILESTAAANGLGFVGMALSTGTACIGAGVAVGNVGAAALGLVGEKPEAMGTTFIYLGLAEGIAIYGIVISILIFSKLA
jgi:V/A-type H+-transporting ATPase subunit K